MSAARKMRRVSTRGERFSNPWQWEPRDGAIARSPVDGWGICTRILVNGLYSVQVFERDTEWGLVEHLAVRRHDGQPVIPWAELQRIKNEVSGPDRLALEVFPPVEQLVDQANMFHLWVMPRGFVLPFGLNGGLVG